MFNTPLFYYLGWLLLVLVLLVVFLYNTSGTLANRLLCVLRQLARRWQWGVGLLLGLGSYPFWYEWRIREAMRRAGEGDTAQAAAAAAAKMVDPEQFYSKLFVAVTVFSFQNLCVWASMVVVFAVIGAWMKGYYAQQRGELPAAPDFKETFLLLPGFQKMLIGLGFMALEAYIVGSSLEAGFRMQ